MNIDLSKLNGCISFFAMLLTITFILIGCSTETDSKADSEFAKAAFERKDFVAMDIALKNLLRANPDDGEARLLRGLAYLELSRGAPAEVQLGKALQNGIAPERIAIPLLEAWMMQKKFSDVISSKNSGAILGAYEQITEESILANWEAIIGIAQLAIGEEAKAKDFFDKAQGLDPQNGRAMLGLAQLEFVANNYDHGVELVKKTVEVAPDYAAAWSVLGDVERAESEFKTAETFYSKALDLRPNNSDDLLARALIRIELNNFSAAEVDLSKLRIIGFDVPHSTYGEGVLALQKTDLDLALMKFEAVASEDVGFMGTSCFIGFILAARDRIERSREMLQICNKKFPNDELFGRIFAVVLAASGENTQARVVLERLTENNLPNPRTLELLAKLEITEGNYSAAEELLRAVIAQEGGNLTAAISLAEALLKSGQEDEASVVFQQMHKALPQLENSSLIEAQSLLRAGKSSGAMKILREIIDSEPENIKAINLLAIAYAQLGETVKSQELLETLMQIDPNHNPAAVNLAKIYVAHNDSVKAIQVLERVIELEPGNVKALGMLTALDVQLGKMEIASKRISEAAANAKPNAELLLLTAQFQKSVGQHLLAIETFNQLVNEFGEKPEWLSQLAESYSQNGQLELAVRTLKDVIEKAPNSAPDQIRLARAYDQLGSTSDAKTAVARALDISPDYPLARLLEIKLLIRDKEHGRARKQLNDLLRDAPDSPIAELNATEGALLLLENDDEGAIEAFERAYEIESTASRLIELARVYASIGRPVDAERSLKERLVKFPMETNVSFVLADLYAKTNRHNLAVSLYREMLGRYPDNPVLLNNLANLLAESSPDEALKTAKRAVDLEPDGAAYLDTYGTILLESGNLIDALPLLRKATEIAPDSAPIQFHFARALAQTGKYRDSKRVLRQINPESLDKKDRLEFDKLKTALLL